MIKLARIGLVAPILLWITGFGLSYQIYGGMNLGWSFNVKLFGATVLLGTVTFVNVYAPFKIKKGQGPDPKIMKIVPMIVRLSLVLVLLGVAITTTL